MVPMIKAPGLADMLLNKVRTVQDIGALEICPLVFIATIQIPIINPIEIFKKCTGRYH